MLSSESKAEACHVTHRFISTDTALSGHSHATVGREGHILANSKEDPATLPTTLPTNV